MPLDRQHKHLLRRRMKKKIMKFEMNKRIGITPKIGIAPKIGQPILMIRWKLFHIDLAVDLVAHQ